MKSAIHSPHNGFAGWKSQAADPSLPGMRVTEPSLRVRVSRVRVLPPQAPPRLVQAGPLELQTETSDGS